MLAIACLASFAVLLNAISLWPQENFPEFSRTINPWNTEARLREIARDLSEVRSGDQTSDLKTLASEAVKTAPYDARTYSVLGFIQQQQGNEEDAQSLYAHALELRPTELQALIDQLIRDVEAKRFQDAFLKLEVAFRRFGRVFRQLTPVLPALLSDAQTYQTAKERLLKLPDGPGKIIAALSRAEGGEAVAVQLVLDWHQEGSGDLRSVINVLTNALLRKKQGLEALRLFRLTLSEEEEKVAGYVFNGDFSLAPNGNPFDWIIADRRGVSLNRIQQAGAENALEARFLAVPINFNLNLQRLRLPPSKFQLTVKYSTSALNAPKPIKLGIACGRRRLGKLVLSATQGERREIHSNFQVPVGECDLQSIQLFNDRIVESWRNRYSGSLRLHSVDIELAGS